MKVDILGVGVSKVTMKEAIAALEKYLTTEEMHMVFTPNPEMIMSAYENKDFMTVMNAADLVVPDGIGVIIGAKMLGTPLVERVPGCDLLINFMKEVSTKGVKFYILGAGQGVALKAKDNIAKEYGASVVGCHDGFFKDEDIPNIIDEINHSGADVLMVGLGVPKQEKFIFAHRHELNTKIALGVGGSIDILAGTVKRAPLFYQKFGLEWFYRLISQPTRAKRMLKLPQFIIEVLKYKKHSK